MVGEIVRTNNNKVSVDASSHEQPVCASYTKADEHDTELPSDYYDEQVLDYFPCTLMHFTRIFGLTNPICQQRYVI